jgi:hypothetical protein
MQGKTSSGSKTDNKGEEEEKPQAGHLKNRAKSSQQPVGNGLLNQKLFA